MGQSQRKHHRKSRYGCTICKTRHIKCDEQRPTCGNCKISFRQCSYPLDTITKRKPQYDQLLDPATWLGTPPEPASPTASDLSSENEEQLFSLRHLSLFRHVDRDMGDWLMVTNTMKPLLDAYISTALETPYLMNLLLSLSAMHLSTSEADPAEYRSMATKLQQKALLGFNKSFQDAPTSSGLPQFLFSSLLGLHFLADKVAPVENDFETTFRNLIKYLQLQRGARLFGERIEFDSEAHKLLAKIKSHDYSSGSVEPDCSRLIADMLSVSDLNEESIESCKGASQALNYLHARLTHAESWGIHALMGFPTFVNLQFISLLEKRTPEALIILSHYCTFLNYFRDFWCIGDAGERVCRGIMASLPPYWAPWSPKI